jgi:UDP-N-acetylglucosamine/UDP-N-acetylgalactosamine 4-epimerase
LSLNQIPSSFLEFVLMQISRIDHDLRRSPKTWLITGVAGFIGSNLLEHLLQLGQRVIGLDDFSSGYRTNLHDVFRAHPNARRLFELIEGDIRNFGSCKQAVEGVDYVLHQAAIASVPRSLLDPVTVNQVNVDGTLNVFLAARDAGVRRVVFASSSAVYGDLATMPLPEEHLGAPMSPYGVSKHVDEQYADTFCRNYDMEIVGLRYFNVFGPRQDPMGGYAAVIPQWIHQLNHRETCRINGDGETSRDFVSVADVVQANILAAIMPLPARFRAYNVGAGRRTSLNELHAILAKASAEIRGDLTIPQAEHVDFRAGDIRHSQADITRITTELGYEPAPDLVRNLTATMEWYFARSAQDKLAKTA